MYHTNGNRLSLLHGYTLNDGPGQSFVRIAQPHSSEKPLHLQQVFIFRAAIRADLQMMMYKTVFVT